MHVSAAVLGNAEQALSAPVPGCRLNSTARVEVPPGDTAPACCRAPALNIWFRANCACRWARVEAAGEPFQPASRFQAVALGPRIYIHTHRCLDMILVLDTAAEPPTLSSAPVLPDPQHGAPSSRCIRGAIALCFFV